MPAAARAHRDPAEVIYADLMARSIGAGNACAFAGMIATRAPGRGLPPWLGLHPAAFRCLLDASAPDRGWCPAGIRACRRRLAGGAQDEIDVLVRLMLMHRAGDDRRWMAHVVCRLYCGPPVAGPGPADPRS
jgi:hypothetical protein